MDIVASIIKLLAHQNSVEVATIGTWYQKKIPGKFDPEKQYFSPPTFEIRFHKLENGDQSLSEFIQKENNVTKSDAELLIKKFSQQVWQQLTDQNIADIYPLGTLNFIEGQLVFKENPNYTLPNQFFGLPNSETTLNKTTDLQAETQQKSELISEDSFAPNSNPEPDKDNELVIDEVWKPTVNQKYEYDPFDEEDENSSRTKFSIFKWIIYIIIVLAVLSTLAYIFYPRYFDSLYRRINPPKYLIENEIDIDTPKHRNSELLVDTNTIDTLLNSLPVDTNYQALTRYEIIGGAMKTDKKAEEIIINYAKRGIVAKKLLNTGGKLIKISLGSYTEFKIANDTKDSLKKVLKNPDLYIQTIKPKN